jgi:hypothetical protein
MEYLEPKLGHRDAAGVVINYCSCEKSITIAHHGGGLQLWDAKSGKSLSFNVLLHSIQATLFGM